jgi:predicted AAA+ superfamily ATPase
MDSPEELQVTRADAARLLVGPEPILIDEWQQYPPSWDLVRRAVDDNPSPARFLLTGSASPTGAPTHSGAGRIVPIRMRPLALAERGIPASVSLADLLSGQRPAISGSTDIVLRDYVDEILASGFPALRGLPDRALRAQLDGYLQRVIDRESPEQGMTVRHPDTLRAWMRAYAAATSTTASFEVIRDAATPGVRNKPAKTTTLPWRDILTQLWLLDPVPAWLPTNNRFKELASADKHQLADPALAARLLNVSAGKLLAGESMGPRVPRDGTLLPGLVLHHEPRQRIPRDRVALRQELERKPGVEHGHDDLAERVVPLMGHWRGDHRLPGVGDLVRPHQTRLVLPVGQFERGRGGPRR